MQIERGSVNTFALMGRPILSPSYWLLWFRDPERNASVYCIATASNTTGGMLTLTFTETNTPTALNGQVKLSPRGNWELKVYEQTSSTNLDPASAGRLVKTIGILVVGEPSQDSGWSGTACPPGGGGDCDPTTVNGTESDTPTILVQQGGVNVGTLNPATGVHTVPECDPCPPCDPLTVTLAGVEIVNEADPCGVDVALECTDLVDAVRVSGAGDASFDGLYLRDADEFGYKSYRHTDGTCHFFSADGDETGQSWLLAVEGSSEDAYSGGGTFEVNPWDYVSWVISGAAGLPPAPTVRQATIGDICGGGDCPACEDVTVQLRDSAGNNIGAADVYAAGVTTTKTAPDGSVQLQDTAGGNLGSPVAVRSNQTGVVVTAPDGTIQRVDSSGTNIGASFNIKSGAGLGVVCPDGTFRTTDGLTTIAAVKSNGTADAPQTRVPYKDAANADQLTTAADTEFASGTLRPDTIIPRITIYESDGVTVQGYADIGNPFYTVDACPPGAFFTKFIWAAGDADTYLWTVTADEAGTYGTYTPTGTNGTLTYSKNGGGYAALSGAITLAVSDTITVRRTTTTNAGSVKWEA